MIRAEVHSDDHVFKADFDATKWFEQASDEEIIALILCGFGGDYPADAVAHFMAEHDSNVARVFQYLEFGPKMPDGDTVGFECHVSDSDASMWIQKHKPELASLIEPDQHCFECGENMITLDNGVTHHVDDDGDIDHDADGDHVAYGEE